MAGVVLGSMIVEILVGAWADPKIDLLLSSRTYTIGVLESKLWTLCFGSSQWSCLVATPVAYS